MITVPPLLAAIGDVAHPSWRASAVGVLKVKFFYCKLLVVGVLVGWLCAGVALAQSGNSDRCEVIAIDVTGKKLSQWDRLEGHRLGIFDTTIAQEELTTKIYPLPKRYHDRRS